MSWEIDVSYVADWMHTLDDGSLEHIKAALEVLSEIGPGLGRPLVDTVSQSRHRNMKELRPGSVGRSEVRILFAFDPERKAILLVGGDKSRQWNRWYKQAIVVADALYDAHLLKLEASNDDS